MLSSREKFKIGNSLICLLKALEGRITTVELRNESFAEGRIDHVDGFMNVKMTSVTFTAPDGMTCRMDHFFVQGSQIRFVQIPDDVDIKDAMQRQLAMIGMGERPKGGGRGRGYRRMKPATVRTQQS